MRTTTLPSQLLPKSGWTTHSEQVDDASLEVYAWHINTQLLCGVHINTQQVTEPPDDVKRKLELMAAHPKTCTNPNCRMHEMQLPTQVIGVDGKFLRGVPIFMTTAFDQLGSPMFDFFSVTTTPDEAVKAHVFAVTLVTGSLQHWGPPAPAERV